MLNESLDKNDLGHDEIKNTRESVCFWLKDMVSHAQATMNSWRGEYMRMCA